MGINLPCGNKPLTTTECGGDCDEKIERLAERVSEAEDKLDTIQEGAEVNVNADWEETDPNSDAYIENKPSVNYDLFLGDSPPTVGSAVVGSAVLGSLVDIILGRGDGTEDRVSVSGTGAIQITRDGDTMTIHVPVGEIDQLRNGTDTEARAWAANVLKQWLDERIAQIPADQFLDLNKTVFANPFTWSSTTYPGSINPNLDGKPVLVLALTDGENVSYSFLNMEDLIDAYEGVAPISVNGSQISHDNSGVTAGSYGDSSNQTPNFGDTFKALRSTVDAKGHVTSMSEHTVKIPDTLATQESAGLMSAEDKEKLDNVDQLYKTTCGNPIVIDDADGEVKALNVELTPIQEGTGTPSPTNIRPIYPHTSLPVRDTGKNLFDNSVALSEISVYSVSGIPTSAQGRYIYLKAGTYTITYNDTTEYYVYGNVINSDGSWVSTFMLTNPLAHVINVTLTEGQYISLFVASGPTSAIVGAKIQIEHGDTATSYAPYTGQTVTVPLNDLYGGIVDVIGGESETGWANIPSYNGETISEPWLSSMDEYVQGATPTTGAQVTYKLATPTPLTTTPTALTLYKGDNVISSEGDMCITYLQDRGDLTDFINEMKACCEEVKGSLLENLVDGTAQGSLRGIDTTQEDANYTIGKDATALGNGTKASGDYSVAEGTQTEASGFHSHAEGVQTKAMQQAAHAEGASTTANALFAHAEGSGTSATGLYAHSEGGGTTASAESAHAEGGSTTAGGKYSHAEGGGCFANANYSHAEGNGTKAVSMSQHVGGEFNELDPTDSATTRGTYVEIIGNGTSDTSRSNARTLDWNGNEALQGALTLGKGTADEVTITAAQLQQLLTLI